MAPRSFSNSFLAAARGIGGVVLATVSNIVWLIPSPLNAFEQIHNRNTQRLGNQMQAGQYSSVRFFKRCGYFLKGGLGAPMIANPRGPSFNRSSVASLM
jgi:hypothetical protein